MKTTVYCKTTAQGTQSFYLRNGAKDYYLFASNFRRSNNEFFGKGVYLDNALAAKNYHSAAVRKIASKLFPAVRYIESEYGVAILNKTVSKKEKAHKGYKRNKITEQYCLEA